MEFVLVKNMRYLPLEEWKKKIGSALEYHLLALR
jgi:hypothetical protein